MPGLLKRPFDRVDNDDGAGAGDGGARGGVNDGAEGPDRKRQAVEQPGEAAGDDGRVNGAAYQVNGASYEDAAVTQQVVKELAQEAPPEIFHVTGSYIPLATMISRLVQDTHNELEAMIVELADMQPRQVNGFGAAAAAQSAQHLSQRKKERIFNFAQQFRVKFIKALVLSQWSRNSDDVSRLIDLHVWINQQKELYRNASWWVGELRKVLASEKVAAPDVMTALDALSTGKAGWYPRNAYDKVEDLTPAQLLRSLRTLNTLLHIRLNLHEEIPPEMTDFSIANGRATFRVEDEFELDLSIADEDPTKQLFFIDMRFLFTPSLSELADGPLRIYINERVDSILEREGLTGCYRFLHELVLTQKVAILRHQAAELASGQWSEQLKIEPVHRSVVIQYWLNRPGPKNWIEIGINRRRNDSGSKLQESPHLSLRWHRHGKEVKNHGIEINPAELDIESLLKEIIASHINYIFKHVKRRLKEGKVYSEGVLSVKHRAHHYEPSECALTVQLSRTVTVVLTADSVSGKLSLGPVSHSQTRAERRINTLQNPARDVADALLFMRCDVTLEAVMARVRMRRWQPVRTLVLNREAVEMAFGKGLLQFTFFRIPAWHKNWVLAMTCSPDGDCWWALELKDNAHRPPGMSAMELASESQTPIRKSLRVRYVSDKDRPTADAAGIIDPTMVSLSKTEEAVAAMVQQWVGARDLSRAGIEFRQQRPVLPLPKVLCPDLVFKLPPGFTRLGASSTSTSLQALLSGKLQEQAEGEEHAWCKSTLKSSHMGLTRDRTGTALVVSGRLRYAIPNIAEVTQALDPGAELAFHPESCEFAFRMRGGPIGAPSNELAVINDGKPSLGLWELKRRLDQIGLVVNFVGLMQRQGLMCSRIALDSATFTYAPASMQADPNGKLVSLAPLDATIDFPPGKPIQIRFAANNPTQRIGYFLNDVLNDGASVSENNSSASSAMDLKSPARSFSPPSPNTSQRVSWVLNLLRTTLPLLRALSQLEADPRPEKPAAAAAASDEASSSTTPPPPPPRLDILPRSATSLRVRYVGRTVSLAYDVRLRERADEAVTALAMPPPPAPGADPHHHVVPPAGTGVVWFIELAYVRPVSGAKGDEGSSGGSAAASPAASKKGKASPTLSKKKDAAAGTGAKDAEPDAAAKARVATVRQAWQRLGRERDTAGAAGTVAIPDAGVPPGAGAGWSGLGGAGVLMARADASVGRCLRRVHEVCVVAVGEADGVDDKDKEKEKEKEKGK